MNDVLTTSRPEMRIQRPGLVPAVIVAALLAVVLAVVGTNLRTPATVALTVDNPHAWHTEVDVRSADSDSWTGAGGIPRNGSVTYLRLPDQGAEWVVRFSYAGHVEEVAVTRDDLAAQDWSLEVPENFATQLAADGVPPSGSAGS